MVRNKIERAKVTLGYSVSPHSTKRASVCQETREILRLEDRSKCVYTFVILYLCIYKRQLPPPHEKPSKANVLGNFNL